MKIARIITITAAVGAAMGMTTQAEAAKRRPAGSIGLESCAYPALPACTYMGSGTDTYVLWGTPVPWFTPIKVYGLRAADPSVGLCFGKIVTETLHVALNPAPSTRDRRIDQEFERRVLTSGANGRGSTANHLPVNIDAVPKIRRASFLSSWGHAADIRTYFQRT